MSYTNRIKWEPLRIVTAPFTSVPQPFAFVVGGNAAGDPLENPSYICKLVNNSTVLVTISIDGEDDVDVAPANSFWLYDEGKVGTSSQYPALEKGTQIYITGTGGTGSVYLVTQYIKQT